jgi:phosphoribosylanthranilate isomerase
MTKIKICGITNLEDARVALGAGADLLGFIFYKPSPRYVSSERARNIVASFKGPKTGSVTSFRGAGDTHHALRTTSPLFVGVFVNTPLPEVERILEFCHLDAVQLHGEEPPEFVTHFNGRAYKALRPKSKGEAEDLVKKYTQLPIAQSPISNLLSPLPHLLLDAYHPTLYGGTGHVTDWTMAANVARQHSIMLAGSLTPENVAEAIQAVKPWGVDVSSGVEAEKGKKDHDKVRAFVEAAKSVKCNRER